MIVVDETGGIENSAVSNDFEENGVVSVIIPAYKVEDYIEDCLNSVLSQTYRDIEIIVVNDGSPDRSAEIAKTVLAGREMSIVVDQLNGGLGAARNTGMRHASGEFVMFLDSDDELPPRAIEALWKGLSESQSDFATGVVERFNKTSSWKSGLFRRPFSSDNYATHITELRELVFDTIACNKLFRRKFWIENNFSFPTRVYFEDIAVIMEAHCTARSVSVISEYVYRWRERDEEAEASITQRRGDPRALGHRVDALESARAMMQSRGADEVIAAFDRKVVTLDFIVYARAIHETSPEYNDVFMARMGSFLRSLDGGESQHLKPLERALFESVRRGDLQTTILLARLSNGTPQRFDRLAISSGLGIFKALRLQPWIQKRKMDHRAKVKQELLQAQGVFRSNHSVKGVSKRVPNAAKALTRKFASLLPPSVALKVTRRVRGSTGGDGQSRRKFCAPGAVVMRSRRDLKSGRRVLIVFNRFRFPVVRRFWPKPLFSINQLSNSSLVLKIVGSDRVKSAYFEAPATGRRVQLERALGNDTNAWVLEAGTLANGSESRWMGWSVTDKGEPRRMFVALDAPTVRLREGASFATLTSNAFGQLNASVVSGAQATRAELSGTVLSVGFKEDSAPQAVKIRHRGLGREYDFAISTQAVNGEVIFSLDLLEIKTRWNAITPLVPGDYHVTVIYEDGEAAPALIEKSSISGADISVVDVDAYVKYQLFVARDATLVVQSRNTYRDDERGKVMQEIAVKRSYEGRKDEPLQNAVIYECYYGKSYSCHPKAIHKELVSRLPAEWSHYWVVSPGALKAPPGTRGVMRWSHEYYELMARAKMVITNCDLPPFFRRNDGQFVVQTWHGTPLKRIGMDIEKIGFANKNYQSELVVQAKQWSLLLSSNPFSTAVFPQAFAYEGEIWEGASPRNDVLVSDGNDALQKRLREQFGISGEKTIILYAPTWRDDARSPQGGYVDRYSHIADEMAAVGDDVVVLYRAHSNIRGREISEYENVIDVSEFADIQELYVLADILVTDYSSTMFDFAATHKPIILYWPDLKHYGSELRGFYFDIQENSPGPIVETVSALQGEVRVLVDANQQAEVRSAFHQKFNAHDDGQGASKVVDRLLKEVNVT